MPTVSSTVQGQSVWLLQAERKKKKRDIRYAKISTLALDERAPHGFVGYANPCTLRCSVRDRPTVKINKRSEKPTDKTMGGVFAARRFIAPPLVSKVSLRFGHARGKTTLSCFLTLSRRFATPMAYAQMRTLRLRRMVRIHFL